MPPIDYNKPSYVECTEMDYWKMYVESGLYVGKHRVPFEATSAYPGHLIAVNADERFNRAKSTIINKEKKQSREAQMLLAQEYGIRVLDLKGTTGKETFKSGKLAGLKQPYFFNSHHVTDERYLDISIDMRITEYQFQLLWKQIQIRAKSLDVHKSKQKGPENSQLLYAIFRARSSGLTFNNIFDLYTSGTLAHYLNHNSQMFLTVKSFTDYYHKYYPHLNRPT